MKVFVSFKSTKHEIEVDGSSSVKQLKDIVYEKTQIQADRQKLLAKGKKLDDASLVKDVLQENTIILLMGSNATISTPSTVAPMDVDKKTPAKQVIKLPVGLRNLGNTCYLNATLQCFKQIPELVDGLATAKPPLHLLYKQMDKHVEKQEPVNPTVFYTLFKAEFPQFAEKQRGMNAQQDAQESWSQLLQSIFKKDPKLEDLFHIQLLETHKSEESPEESSVKTVFENMVKVNIQSSTSYLEAGIKESMSSHLKKRSEKLSKDIEFQVDSKFAALPKYLTVNLVRFYWKQSSNLKAKILKRIKFPFVLDLYDVCTDEYKQVIKSSRVNALKDQLSETGSQSGVFDLIGVLTHVGRTSDSGHYIAWIKQDKIWIKCDDETMSVVPESEIERLYGSADWHTGYIMLYKARLG